MYIVVHYDWVTIKYRIALYTGVTYAQSGTLTLSDNLIQNDTIKQVVT